MSDERLTMVHTLALLDEARATVEGLDGAPLNVESNDKDRNQRRALVRNKLLYAAHLVDLARADVMNQYHRYKGEDPPEIIS